VFALNHRLTVGSEGAHVRFGSNCDSALHERRSGLARERTSRSLARRSAAEPTYDARWRSREDAISPLAGSACCFSLCFPGPISSKMDMWGYFETRSLEMDVPIWVKAASISLGLLSMKKFAEPLAHLGSTGDTPVPSSSWTV
jgi:hypothetical protein